MIKIINSAYGCGISATKVNNDLTISVWDNFALEVSAPIEDWKGFFNDKVICHENKRIYCFPAGDTYCVVIEENDCDITLPAERQFFEALKCLIGIQG